MDKNREIIPDISTFLASAAHDMKNSIGVMIDFLEKNITGLDPEAQKNAVPMLFEVKRVNANFIQMLAIYKMGNQFYPFDLTENSIDNFVREVVGQCKAILDYSNIELEVDSTEGLTWYFDYELVLGVISHALNNAARYAKNRLRLSVEEKNGELVMRVEDDGSGFSESVLNSRNDAGKEVNFASGSTGLGLFFSSLVAKLHKNAGKTGGIFLENGGRYGGGCFILRLP